MSASPTTPDAPDQAHRSAAAAPVRKYLLFSLCALIFFFAAAFLDLVLRARSAYLEGEKYMAWAADPGLKADFYDKLFSPRLASLENDLARNRVTKTDLEDQKRLLLAERDFKVRESSVKYAYIWYKTAASDFSPPVTRWTRLAREKAPEALKLWKNELAAQKTPFKDHFFD